MLVDASALLWRLQLCGVDVRSRWRAVADGWAQLHAGGLRPFTDAHAMLAFVAAGRRADADELIGSLRASAAVSHDLVEVVEGAALPVCAALQAFAANDYRTATAILNDVRHLAKRCGGSQAQCDLLHLTLLESALRGGQRRMGHQLVAERIATRPLSPFNQRLLARVGERAEGIFLAAPKPRETAADGSLGRRVPPRISPMVSMRAARAAMPPAAGRPRA
jgi:hypothetical protein